MQEIVGNLARAGTSAGASASSMLSALIAVGDEVILKSENRGSASMVGTVSESIVNKGSARPVYRVRCASFIGEGVQFMNSFCAAALLSRTASVQVEQWARDD